MTVWATDWTHWQGVRVPAKQIADEGFGMVKLKAGGSSREGWSFEDPMFQENADALLAEPRLVPAVYWYLVPGHQHAQAGLFMDLLINTGAVEKWAAYVDVEQDGLKWFDFMFFVEAWNAITEGKTLSVYTSKRFWTANMEGHDGSRACPVLEEAHWVPEAVRKDPARPYASQQAKAIQPSWWTDGYVGWNPAGIQFTDNALIAGKRNVAAQYLGSNEELRARIV
jgi:hypothetical protein